ncbi:DUF3024 family protein [Azonexus fungiphilus]|jgi:hypothetical protein|uniref:DUF3024 family protein n=1 Tax=Azonexus fungiphilus TaxID=146940 RepID=A0A495WHU9_9RHOO|nr:DUF3024 domain-containing protein [Azonexus fungiphilus]RKT60949.1 DUF3024 family protein [Azonexus fungiphilus]
MPLPVLIQHLVRNRLGAYCERRVPADARATQRLELRFTDDAVIVVDSRQLDNRWLSLEIARFRYNPAAGTWLLDAPHFGGTPPWRQHSRKPVREIERLIALLDEDADGVFWS